MDIQELANIMDPRPEQTFQKLSQDDPDGLYYKYRVFREPADTDDHPVPMDCEYHNADNQIRYMEEVKEFVFVLKPDSDVHARIAMAAYAQSVTYEKPQLAEDLWEVLKDV